MTKSVITPRMLVDYTRGPRFFEARYVLKSIEPHTVTTEETFEQSIQDLLFTDECDSVTCPAEYLDTRGNMTTTAAKDWKAKAIADGQKVLSHSDWQNLRFAVDSAREQMVKCLGIENPEHRRNFEIVCDDDLSIMLPRWVGADSEPLFLFVVARVFEFVDFLSAYVHDPDGGLEPVTALSEAFYTLVAASNLQAVKGFNVLLLEQKPPFQCLGMRISSASVDDLRCRAVLIDELRDRMAAGDWSGIYEAEPYHI